MRVEREQGSPPWRNRPATLRDRYILSGRPAPVALWKTSPGRPDETVAFLPGEQETVRKLPPPLEYRAMNRFVGTGALWLVAASSFTHGATAADEPLLAGVAQVDITPPPGEMMWGYSNRPQPATGKLDPLMARVLVLACGDVRAAIVTLDLGRTPEDSLLADLRERTLSKHDLGDLFVTASHTHAAPTLESLDGKPNAYGPTVIEAIDRAIDEAAAKLVPVQLGVGRGTVDIAHNRRHFLPDGRVAMQWRNAEHEPTSPVDKEFVVIRLDRADGKPLAVLLHYACHPVVLGPDNLEFHAPTSWARHVARSKKTSARCAFTCRGAVATSIPTSTRRRAPTAEPT